MSVMTAQVSCPRLSNGTLTAFTAAILQRTRITSSGSARQSASQASPAIHRTDGMHTRSQTARGQRLGLRNQAGRIPRDRAYRPRECVAVFHVGQGLQLGV